MMLLIWTVLHLDGGLACAGTSDELREGWIGIATAVASGRCEVVLWTDL